MTIPPPPPPKPSNYLRAIEELEKHATELGHLNIAWANLQDGFAYLFSVLANANEQHVVLAAWNTSTNDRAQRAMVAAAAKVRYPDEKHRLAVAIDTLVKESNRVADARNNAVHAPFEADYVKGEVVPSTRWGNPRAKALLGKDLLVELRWCRRASNELASFARSIAGWIDLLHHEMITGLEDAFPKLAMPTRPQIVREVEHER